MIALGTISTIVRRTMLKYDEIRSSDENQQRPQDIKWHLLMTSTSWASLSDMAEDALSVAGGGSMLAIFFLFRPWKKLPKKPPPASAPSRPGLGALGGKAEAGSGLPVLGSTWVGRLAGGLCFSWTIAMACRVSTGKLTRGGTYA